MDDRGKRGAAWALVIVGIVVLIAVVLVLRSPRDDGVRSIVLSPEAATGAGRGELVGPGTGKQDYTITRIDTRAFSDGGLLVVDITMGPGESAGSFDLFEEDADLPEDPLAQEQLRRSHSVASCYDLRPTMRGRLVHHFQTGEVFQLGGTGPWFSGQGARNTFELDARILGPDELEKAFRDPGYGVDAGSGGSPHR